ncbi:unnamed protein product [Callosobruchus maculatus]|uniref:Uncharacterized protein n=1 Tax=Callosobruchus maculatus TaxID=64391 RepID=A0A653CCQ8_CALMS|nr:unnamed protein product [Callosobruchus maculatus]
MTQNLTLIGEDIILFRWVNIFTNTWPTEKYWRALQSTWISECYRSNKWYAK